MSDGPDLADGETLLHHHTPDLAAFKRTALLMLAITLVPTGVMFFAFPDTLWVAVPLFVTCLLLMQERVTLGKYAAWITNQRVILQSDQSLDLAQIDSVDVIGNAVRIRPVDRGARVKLYYPKDRAELLGVLNSARGGRSHDPD